MIQYAILGILSILISANPLGVGHGLQNITEEINYLFSDLTPGNLGVKQPQYQENDFLTDVSARDTISKNTTR